MQKRTELTLEWAGALMAVMGAFLVAINTGYSKHGYLLLTASSFLLIPFFRHINAKGLFLMQLVFLVINLVGVWRWYELG